MLSSSGPGSISPLLPSQRYFPTAEREVQTQTAPNRKFDSVTLSASSEGKGRFYMDMVSRLSQEVRTATTTGDIQALRQQVSTGTYTPDPMAIAAKMLYLGEDS